MSVYSIHITKDGERLFTSVALLKEEVRAAWRAVKVKGGYRKRLYDICSNDYKNISEL